MKCKKGAGGPLIGSAAVNLGGEPGQSSEPALFLPYFQSSLRQPHCAFEHFPPSDLKKNFFSAFPEGDLGQIDSNQKGLRNKLWPLVPCTVL